MFGSVESSNIAPSECDETTERSGASAINTFTKMTAMKAVMVNQSSIYNASTDGKMLMSDASNPYKTANQLEQMNREDLKGQKRNSEI